MDEYNPDHFVTPRSSGLHSDYFEDPPTRLHGWVVWIIIGAILGAIVASYVASL